MKLGLFNVDDALKTELIKHVNIEILDSAEPTNINCMFINWISKDSKDVHRLVHQTRLLEYATGSQMPTIIFDSTLDLTEKEIAYLKKNKVVLFEPTIKTRPGVLSLPFWLHVPKNVELCDDIDKQLDLVYCGNKNNVENDFIQFYSSLLNTSPNLRIEHDTDSNVFKSAKCSVLIGTEYEYLSGYMPNLEPMLTAFCVPLLPCRHRFYHSLFKNLVVHDPKDIRFILDNYDMMNYGLISDIYHRIRKYFPEMKVENVAQKITSVLKRG
jgi:hypothetical protein